MSKQPKILWAQRSDKVYLTVSLPDANAFSVKCGPESFFKFSAVDVNGESCNFTLQLYGNISPQGCKTKIGLGNIICSMQKEQKGWWKRLLKSEAELAPYIKVKVDWDKWCDEDEDKDDEDEDKDKDDENLESNLPSTDDIMDAVEDEESSDGKEMLLTSSITKKRKIDEPSLSLLIPEGRENKQGRCLVICSTVFHYARQAFYTFESIPIEKLIHDSSKCMQLEPIKEQLFVWCSKNEPSKSDTCDPCYSKMSLLHVGDLIYVVGGVEPLGGYIGHYRKGFFPYPNTLPKELRCISLRGEVKLKCPMLGKTYYPLITEINGLIYVLSKPPPTYATSIIAAPLQVYHPLEDRWEILPRPPSPFMEIRIQNDFADYGYFVFANKLYVSTLEYASCYDTAHHRWETCDILFETDSFTYWEPSRLPYPDDCGHPFPFMKKATHFKNNIFLCMIDCEGCVGAFQITDDKEAKRVFLLFDSLPYGQILDLVDLGDDCFVVLVSPRVFVDAFVHEEKMTVIIFFKIHLSDDGDLICTEINRLSDPRVDDESAPIYSFIM